MSDITRRPDGQFVWQNFTSNGLDAETVGDYRASMAVRDRVDSLWHSQFTSGLREAIHEGRFSDGTLLFAAAVTVRAEAVALPTLVMPSVFCPVCAALQET